MDTEPTEERPDPDGYQSDGEEYDAEHRDSDFLGAM